MLTMPHSLQRDHRQCSGLNPRVRPVNPRPSWNIGVMPRWIIGFLPPMMSCSSEKELNSQATVRLMHLRPMPGKNTESSWPKRLFMLSAHRNPTVRVLSCRQSVPCGTQQGVARRKSAQCQDSPCRSIATKRVAAPGGKPAFGQSTRFEEPHRAVELRMFQWQSFDLMASQRGQQRPGNLYRGRSNDDHKQTGEDEKY